MVVCPSCLAESADGSRFCASCGRALPSATSAPSSSATPVEERKTVSVLFCDLVGFTAMSEAADPEDIGQLLDRYAELARSAIRTHGGVIEKFIGDAVVGVFGVPLTHEDDALRAVRAGLAICERAARAGLRLRVGINTGQALVRLDLDPSSGERFMTGDAVNTAARIQSVAPELGVAVGEATWHATRHAVEFAELPRATLKGKTELVRMFQAIGPSAIPALASEHGGPFVGRAAEVARLTTTFERVIADRRPAILLVAGEPGIGKSRVVGELHSRAEAVAPDVRWRQGRCLPYGDGITFWALGEVVKGHAGILEGDEPDMARSKLESALAGFEDRDWLMARLLPLVGVVTTGSAPARAEAFLAWRSFLAGLARDTGAVVVLEDLHWADDALLEFVAELGTTLAQVPLLVVGTARPELFARSALPGAILGMERLDLAPLPDDEAAQLVVELFGTVLPTELRDPIIARADGNPLFAEEYVRLLTDRGLLIETEGAMALAEGAELPIPDSIGALLAARLDTLPRPRKAILADASVVGETFWTGTVAAMGDRDRGAVADELGDLSRLEFVRGVRPSSMAGEDESAFWHALGRDVAYAQLPRAARAGRHVAAARWLEAKAGDRVADIAEVLAHHYTTALDLAEATGDASLAATLRPSAAGMLRLSGDRALNLDTAAALVAYERALALMADDDPDRAAATHQVGTARFYAGQYEEAVAAYQEALNRHIQAGDEHAAALVKLELARALQWVGRTNWALQVEAVSTLEAEGPSPDLVRGLGMLTFVHLISDRPAEATATADRAIELAATLGLPPPAGAYAWRGSTRCLTGDPGGLDDGRVAIALATAAGTARDAAIYRNEYAANVSWFVGARAAEVAITDFVEFAASRGLRGLERLGRAGLAFSLWEQGSLVKAEAAIRSSIAAFEAAGDLSGIPNLRGALMQLATLRGDTAEASGLAATLETDPHLEDSPDSPGTLAAIARAYAEAGDLEGAKRVLARMATQEIGTAYRGLEIRDAVIAMLAIGDRDAAARLVGGSDDPRPYGLGTQHQARALVAEADGDTELAVTEFGTAAAILEPLSVPNHAQALLGQGRCLVALGRGDAAIAPLKEARDLAVRMGTRPWIAEASGVLAQLEGIETPAGGTPAGA